MVGETRPRSSGRRGTRAAACSFLAASVLTLTPGAASADVRPDPYGWRKTGQLLEAVVRDGRVDYELLGTRRDRLDACLDAMARAPERIPRGGQPGDDRRRLAFYINAYNVATLDLVDRERRKRGGRLESIREIPAAWTRPTWTIAGASRTLDEIEHQVLRKEFHEPRIHMALVCASVSCPALRAEPYEPDSLEDQLDAASESFVNDPTRNRFAPRDGAIRISKIFDWYGEDFVGVYRDAELERRYGEKDGAVLAFAARYVPTATAAMWRTSRLKIEYLPYDWSLNAAPAASK